MIALGRGHRLRRPDGNPLAAKPYDAADQISLQRPADGGKKADPDKPLEVTAKGDDGRITDVTATDAAGPLSSRANSPPTAAAGTAPPRWPPAPTTRCG